jgi:hypothetical protein
MRRCLSATNMLGALLSLATCLYSGYGHAAEPSISCTLSTPKTEYVIGEPLELRVTLRNDGDAAVTFIQPSEVGIVPVRVYIIPPGGSSWQMFSPALHLDYGVRWLTLGAGESISVRGAILGRDAGKEAGAGPHWVLYVSGEYQVKAVFSVKLREQWLSSDVEPPTISSEELHISVRRPSEEEAKALAIWGEGLRDYGYSVNALAPNPSLMTLLREYPDTIYADHVNYALAEDPTIVFDEKLQGQTGTEYQASLLEKVLSHGSAFPLRDAAMLRLAELYAVQKRYSDAVSQLEQLIAEMPDSMFADKAEERLAGLEERVEKPGVTKE